MKFEKAPMGWNSWDCYGAAVDEETVRKNAKYMAENLKDAGYEYVVVDIQWYEPLASTNEYHPFTNICLDEYGRCIPAENRFPSSKGGKGFGPLAEYIHSLGLKFGIHIMRGIPRQAVTMNTPVLGTKVFARDIAKTNSICYWNTDMYGVDTDKEGGKEYYDSIFDLYSSWGVDFIKCDDICREIPREEHELIALSKSLHEAKREMVLSLSPGPALLEKAELYKEIANMWRITDDFWDEWKLLYAMFERCEKWSIHTGYGAYPDADMLPVGPLRQCYDPKNVTKFTEDEQITMMTLWSVFRSPLMIGGEMTKFDDFTLSILTNKELMRMHKLSRNAHQIYRKNVNGVETVLWTAQCEEGGRYICVFNLGEEKNTICIKNTDIETEKTLSGFEIWSGEKAELKESLEVSVKSHGAKAFYFDK